jgi:hypothetical protein
MLPTTKARLALLLAALAAIGVSYVALRPASSLPNPGAGVPPATADLTGTRTNDMVAIGGDTTGWMLMPRKAGDAPVEVDISAVLPQASALAGAVVDLWGSFTMRDYVERGKTPVFVVTRIVPTKP